MIKTNLLEDWENIDEMLHRKELLYIPEIMRLELISRHRDDSWIGQL